MDDFVSYSCIVIMIGIQIYNKFNYNLFLGGLVLQPKLKLIPHLFPSVTCTPMERSPSDKSANTRCVRMGEWRKHLYSLINATSCCSWFRLLL